MLKPAEYYYSSVSPVIPTTLTSVCRECKHPHSYTFLPDKIYNADPGEYGWYYILSPLPDNGRYAIQDCDLDWQDERRETRGMLIDGWVIHEDPKESGDE